LAKGGGAEKQGHFRYQAVAFEGLIVQGLHGNEVDLKEREKTDRRKLGVLGWFCVREKQGKKVNIQKRARSGVGQQRDHKGGRGWYIRPRGVGLSWTSRGLKTRPDKKKN